MTAPTINGLPPGPQDIADFKQAFNLGDQFTSQEAALLRALIQTSTGPTINTLPLLAASLVGQPVTWSAGTATGASSILYSLRNSAGVELGTVSGGYTPTAAAAQLTVYMTAVAANGQTAQGQSNTVSVGQPLDGYDIILTVGSSNMSGRGAVDSTIDAASTRVMQFGSLPSDTATYRQIVAAPDPLKYPDNISEGSGVGPALAFAKRYTAATGRRVLLVPCAFGGTSIVSGTVRWSPYGTTGTSDLYRASIDQANAAIAAAKAVYPDSQFVGVLASPGGNDADANTITRATWIQPFRDLISGLRAGITGAANTWTIVFQMLPETLTTRPLRKVLDDAQREVVASTQRMAFVTIGLGFANSDVLHYNSLGQRGTTGLLGIGGVGYSDGIPAAQARLTTTLPGTPGTPAISGSATANAASFIWTQPNGGVVSDFNVRYRVVGASTWTTLTRTASTQAVAALTGLAASTNYEAQVQASGPAGISAWSSSGTFTTAASAGTASFARLVPASGSNMRESGDATNGWTYGADVLTGSTPTHAGSSDKKLALGVASYLEMTLPAQVASTLFPYMGLVTTQSDPERGSGATGYKYTMVPSGEFAEWQLIAEGAAPGTANITPTTKVAPQAGDKFRLETAADGTVSAKIARSSDPTVYTTIYVFPIKATTDLWPAFSFGNTGTALTYRAGPVVVGTL